jgi:hypothetical protein
MPKDAKRSLITWRCADCGRDLSTVDHIFVDGKGNARCCCDGCAVEDIHPEPADDRQLMLPLV